MLLPCDVGPYSLRSLSRMIKVRLGYEWDHTAAVIAIIHNSRMGIKRNQMIDAEKLNPYRQKKKRKRGKIKIADMARGFGVK